MEVYYPGHEYSTIDVIFNSSLDNEKRELINGIVRYWGSIPYVGEYLDHKWITPESNVPLLSIQVDETKSTSDDSRAREPLELLGDFISNGTPPRKTKNNTRAYNGVGNCIRLISAI